MQPNPNLPEPRSIGNLTRRAEVGLNAVHNIQLEASAHYWFERGNKHKAALEWDAARYCFYKALSIDKWHYRAWLFNAVANCMLDNAEEFYACIVQAYLKGVFEPDRWFVSALEKSEWELIQKKVKRRYLTCQVLDYNYDYGEWPFDWTSLDSFEKSTSFLNKILAAAIVIYNVWLGKGGYYSQYDENDNDFSGGFYEKAQPIALGELIDRVLDCSGIATEFYSPCPKEGRSVWKQDAQGKYFETTEFEDRSLTKLFPREELQNLFDVTASLIGGARMRLSLFHKRIEEAGYNSAYTNFHLGLSLLRLEKYAEAVEAFEYARAFEPRFNESSLFWCEVAAAKLQNYRVIWDSDAIEYHRVESKDLLKQSDVQEAIKCLEKAASLSRNEPIKWIAAGNAVLWYQNDFTKGVAYYQTAIALCKEVVNEEMILPKLWAQYNCSRACFAMGFDSQALNIYHSLALTLNVILGEYYGKDSVDKSSYEDQLVSLNVTNIDDLIECRQTIKFISEHGFLFLSQLSENIIGQALAH
ncbi:hypothetical protein FY528_19445 [Hymenobacter lutimineralis]|uniref:Uncharacterized protein n=1 Tax=Hymenobacter lutimineralis TaxID=2606448 RepID=A0A5D6URM5_9BACT|nr:hypothetical protein [Hymenobacter lutimineralis]TYZ06103.1 hypothetical protein FY528_19445 [Hymenobacter lutimineralis]